MSEKIKALANNILEQCREQELTLGEMRLLRICLEARIEETIRQAMDEVLKQNLNSDLLQHAKMRPRAAEGGETQNARQREYSTGAAQWQVAALAGA